MKTNIARALLALVVITTLAGCNAKSATPAEKKANFIRWGSVCKGMAPGEVGQAWGHPLTARTDPLGRAIIIWADGRKAVFHAHPDRLVAAYDEDGDPAMFSHCPWK